MSTPAIQFLPRTAIAAFALSTSEIYTYAQGSNKKLVQVSGSVSDAKYSSDDYSSVNVSGMTTAKLFTPLAAAFYHDKSSNVDRRYVFYVDDNNLLRDVYFESNKWHIGSLSGQNCVCAPYSKLAAIRLVNPGGYNFVTVYYQTTGDNGDIKEVSLNNGTWAKGQPDLDDPPLYGTSLSAVTAEPGIESTSSSTSDTDKSRLPVMFFQYNTLGLGSSQDAIAYSRWTIDDNSKSLSSHAALTAVDDGTNLWAFYTSDDNQVQRVRIDKDANLTQPTAVALDMTPMPGSPLEAVLVTDSNNDYIVLFYLLHYAASDDVPTRTDIYATALSKTLTADADTWSTSSRVLLTG
ncbi:predicted protein [Chaetomium globosum CBS 148.51]|uniref:Uncharacterized protein n=1 Tax=Chaetomium globosum (strain ATCC 6205 / CBS 148.51 / DSM 1962 / NBRC 6347 / NRRL 1970) TaxID=306901 RepID=Q2H7R9_CHAGB|nr:uncharacterized protein CHGG_05296 [Chaetomium globosum CBS 148.51]EAQ88677.1 predicted protein [Chaetomium globosum CBS 148.51]